MSVELVADVGKERQLLRLQQLCDALDETRLLHLVRDFGDDDLIRAAPGVFLLPARAQAEAAAPGLVGLDDRLARLDDDAAGREVGARHEIDELLGGCVRELDQMQGGIAQLPHIMRRDVGGHADRDAGGTVRQKVREIGRQDDGLFVLAVIVRTEVDGVVVDALEQHRGHCGQARLRVTHRSGIIAVDIAEIALAVDKRIAHREILRQAHQRIVDSAVAMRMVFADDVADDAGAFLEAALGIKL